MKTTHTIAVVGSALGLLLVSGAYAGDQRLSDRTQEGEGPVIYFDQHIGSDQWMPNEGARGPVRNDSMDQPLNATEQTGEGPVIYFMKHPAASDTAMPKSGARGPVRNETMERLNETPQYGEGPTIYDEARDFGR